MAIKPYPEDQMIEELKALHIQLKANNTGKWPRDKTVEEAIEVVLAYLGEGNQEEEEFDLLMCLLDKHMYNKHGLYKWCKKLVGRGRIATTAQQEYMERFGMK